MNYLTPSRRTQGQLSRPTDPFGQMRRQFDALFNQFMSGWPALANWEGGEARLWNFDVDEKDNEIAIRADLPGFAPNEVDVQLNDNVLTIRAEHEQEGEGQQRYSSYERSVTLPPGIDAEKAQANYRHGVLELHIPRTEQGRGRRIPIQEHAGAQGQTGGQAQGQQTAGGKAHEKATPAPAAGAKEETGKGRGHKDVPVSGKA